MSALYQGLRVPIIDLLMGFFRGAVFHHGEVPENGPLALMGRFPSLMVCFPTLMGRFPECLNTPFFLLTGRPRFGSVRLRFGDGTVQAVPVFGSGGFSAKRVFCVSVQFKTGKQGSGFRFRFLENGSGGSGSAFSFRKNGSDGSGFDPVPVRFLSHPVLKIPCKTAH